MNPLAFSILVFKLRLHSLKCSLQCLTSNETLKAYNVQIGNIAFF